MNIPKLRDIDASRREDEHHLALSSSPKTSSPMSSATTLFMIHAMESPIVTPRRLAPNSLPSPQAAMVLPPMNFSHLSINEPTGPSSSRRNSSLQQPQQQQIPSSSPHLAHFLSAPSPSSSANTLPKILDNRSDFRSLIVTESINEEDDLGTLPGGSPPSLTHATLAHSLTQPVSGGSPPSLNHSILGHSHSPPQPRSSPFVSTSQLLTSSPASTPASTPRPRRESSLTLPPLGPMAASSPFAEAQPSAAAPQSPLASSRPKKRTPIDRPKSKDNVNLLSTSFTMSGQVTPRGRNREGSDEAVELMMGTARSRTVVFADARSAPLVTVLDTPYHIAQLQLQLKALEEEEMRLEAAKKAAKKWKDKSKNSLSSSTSAALHQVDEPSSGRMLRKASSDLDLKVLRGGSSQRLEGFGSERCEVKRTSRQKRIMEARTAVLREPEPETVQRSETSAADRSMKAHQTMGKGWWGRMTAGAKDKEGTFDVDGCF